MEPGIFDSRLSSQLLPLSILGLYQLLQFKIMSSYIFKTLATLDGQPAMWLLLIHLVVMGNDASL